MLHLLMHRFHWRPDEIYNLPPEVKRFIYTSMLIALEEEEKAYKAANKNK